MFCVCSCLFAKQTCVHDCARHAPTDPRFRPVRGACCFRGRETCIVLDARLRTRVSARSRGPRYPDGEKNGNTQEETQPQSFSSWLRLACAYGPAFPPGPRRMLFPEQVIMHRTGRSLKDPRFRPVQKSTLPSRIKQTSKFLQHKMFARRSPKDPRFRPVQRSAFLV